MEESLERAPANLKENLGPKLLDAPKNLESDDIGLKFQLKMLECMDSMNKEIKYNKKKRIR